MGAMVSADSFGARGTLSVGDSSYEIHRLAAVDGADRLPFSLKILLENLLRTEDGADVTADDVRALAGWDPAAEPDREIRFTPARVVMQDFTGGPGGGRPGHHARGGRASSAATRPGSTRWRPAELVIDHSVVADLFGTPDSFTRNVELEYERNYERYQFLRWGQGAFADFKVVPPGTGIVHQVNIEYLARVVFTRDGAAYPDTLVGTDSHTTMVNGLGVLGWGVGGIEAEAAMLGQPVSMLIPRVVGLPARRRAAGGLHRDRPGAHHHPDAAQARRGREVRRVLRAGRRRGAAGQPGDDRQHEPGVRLDLRDLPDRRGDAALPALHRPARGAGRAGRGVREGAGPLARPAGSEPAYSETLALDLSTVVPSLAGPKRPQDRVALADGQGVLPQGAGRLRRLRRRRVRLWTLASPGPSPPRDPVAVDNGNGAGTPHVLSAATGAERRASRPTAVTLEDGTETEVDHGAVVIAAITSCTNTSNPSVMIGAALLAKKAVERGLQRQPWVKTTLAPGLQGGHGLLRARRPDAVPGEARLPPGRLRLHHLHRQLRAAAGAGVARPSTSRTSRWSRCCPATATSRAGSTRT